MKKFQLKVFQTSLTHYGFSNYIAIGLHQYRDLSTRLPYTFYRRQICRRKTRQPSFHANRSNKRIIRNFCNFRVNTRTCTPKIFPSHFRLLFPPPPPLFEKISLSQRKTGLVIVIRLFAQVSAVISIGDYYLGLISRSTIHKRRDPFTNFFFQVCYFACTAGPHFYRPVSLFIVTSRCTGKMNFYSFHTECNSASPNLYTLPSFLASSSVFHLFSSSLSRETEVNGGLYLQI